MPEINTVATKNGGRGRSFFKKADVSVPSILMSCMIVIIWHQLGMPWPDKPDFLLSSSVCVASVFSGFLRTSTMMLISIRSASIMRKMQKSGYIHDLITELKVKDALALIFLFVALLGFYIPSPEREASVILHLYRGVFVFFGTLNVITFYSTLSGLLLLLKHSNDAEESSKP